MRGVPHRIKVAKSIGAMALLPFMAFSTVAAAEDITAGSVMTKLKGEERYAFLAGVTEGLAYGRYVRDGKTTLGMACIYKWFYETDSTVAKIHSAFERFGNHTPGAVMAALAEKECGA